MLSKRKLKNSTKNLSAALQVVIDPLDSKLGYTNSKRPSRLIYPMYLSPPSSYSNKASQNRVLSSFSDPAICPIASAKSRRLFFGKSPKLPKLQNTIYTLKRCGLCLGTNLLSRYVNRKRKEKRLQ